MVASNLSYGGSWLPCPTFEQLGRSRHVADLRLIFSVTVIMMIVGVIAALAFCYESQAVTNWKELHQGGGIWPWVLLGFAAIVSSGPFVGAICMLGGGVLAWTYQTGGVRLGVVDLFACEIATLCRAAPWSHGAVRYHSVRGGTAGDAVAPDRRRTAE